jgi:hypothetical protein
MLSTRKPWSTAESIHLAYVMMTSAPKLLRRLNAAQLPKPDLWPKPGLCEFCSTEVWGDRGWRRLWRESAFTGGRLLEYRQSYRQLKRSARQSCFLCRLVYKLTEDENPGRNDQVPEYISMSIDHHMPSRVTPGTCAKLSASWFVMDINDKEIGEGDLSFGVSTVASKSDCIRERET